MKKNIIERFKEVHGEEQYDYSEVLYTKIKDKVKIKCNKHEYIFEQTPDTHLRGSGCPLCAKERTAQSKKKGYQHFLELFNKLHENKYTYPNFKEDYDKGITKINIECPKHGLFNQEISNHSSGKGCNKCAREKVGELKKFSKKEILEQFNNTHGDLYNYDKFIEYKESHQIIDIGCKKHNNYFKQSVTTHKRGSGCPECGMERSNEFKKANLEYFINKGVLKHNAYYSYNNAEYVGSDSNTIITCPKHGGFKQTFNNHLQGKGCPKCVSNISKAEKEIVEFLSDYIEVEQSNKIILEGKEIDIYLPSFKIRNRI